MIVKITLQDCYLDTCKMRDYIIHNQIKLDSVIFKDVLHNLELNREMINNNGRIPNTKSLDVEILANIDDSKKIMIEDRTLNPHLNYFKITDINDELILHKYDIRDIEKVNNVDIEVTAIMDIATSKEYFDYQKRDFYDLFDTEMYSLYR